MARDPSLFSSPTPAAVVPAEVQISHVQLRDLIICPKETGVVNYVQSHRIVEHDLRAANVPPRVVADLDFTPNCLTSLRLGPSGEDVLIAAGGQEADIHISYHRAVGAKNGGLKNTWSIDRRLTGSINNSVLLTTSVSTAPSNQSSAEPRIGVSNNDFCVRLYDVPLRGTNSKRVRRNEESLLEVGMLRLDVPINHSSISPDGQTLLSVGDSNKVYIHDIRGGHSVTLSAITTYTLPPADYSSIPPPSGSLAASFSTTFSSDGFKFAVGSQEGIVAVWDIRSAKPMKVYHTEKTRTIGRLGNGAASGWLSNDPWDWSRNNSRAPGWSVRNVKFGGSSRGKEVLTFTEHTSLVHIIDAQTFETEEIFEIPTVRRTALQSISPSASQPNIGRPSGSPINSRTLHPPATAPPSRRAFRHSPFYSFPSPSPSPPRNSAARNRNTNMIGSPTPNRDAASGDGGRSTPSIVHEIGDAFRVAYSPPESIGDSTWRTLLGTRSPAPAPSTSRTTVEAEENAVADSMWQSEFDDIVVIPPLGNTDEESEIHALLQMHGIPTMQSRAEMERRRDEEGDDRDEDDEMDGATRVRRGPVSWLRDSAMDVDELDSDCTSSYANSRASSPVPWPNHGRRVGGSRRNRVDEQNDQGEGGTTRKEEKELHYVNDLDIAGVCFDPGAQNLYVASTRSVVEWKIRDAEKQYWPSDGWR